MKSNCCLKMDRVSLSKPMMNPPSLPAGLLQGLDRGHEVAPGILVLVALLE